MSSELSQLETRIDYLGARVDKLEKPRANVKYAEERVLSAARNLIRFKKLGWYIDGNERVNPNPRDPFISNIRNVLESTLRIAMEALLNEDLMK